MPFASLIYRALCICSAVVVVFCHSKLWAWAWAETSTYMPSLAFMFDWLGLPRSVCIEASVADHSKQLQLLHSSNRIRIPLNVYVGGILGSRIILGQAAREFLFLLPCSLPGTTENMITNSLRSLSTLVALNILCSFTEDIFCAFCRGVRA